MKKLLLFLSLLLAILSSKAQNLQISFAGKGASSSVSSVKVENLTRGTSVVLKGNEVLQLPAISTGIVPTLDNKEKSLRIYPNPMTDRSSIEFVATSPGTTNIELFDITGKRVACAQNTLAIGIHSCQVSGLKTGIYAIKINSQGYSYTGKLVSNGTNNTGITITYQGSNTIINQSQKLKSAKSGTSMQYSTGDLILFTGTSGIYSTVIASTPTQSGVITFTFVPCTDADGNNYPVVQIGTQVWMVENLKTTHYRNNGAIPNVADNAVWRGLTTGAYCWYNNDEASYKNPYGALYNWYAVNDNRNLCPTGWHVPTDAEWKILSNYLGGNSASGGKLKETGIIHWGSPNSGATNETGFTALPGGFRNDNPAFGNIGNFGYWWSASEILAGFPRSYIMHFDNPKITPSDDEKKPGFSVRCIHDNSVTVPLIGSEAAINDTLLSCYSQVHNYVELEYLFDAVYSNSVSSPSASWTEIYDHTESANNDKVLKIWSKAYDIIYSTNLIIKSSEMVISDQASQNTVIAQAKAMRAYLYYNLLTWFGEVPLETGFSESMISRNSIEEVLAQIIKDATDASQSLPMNWVQSDNFRIPQSFAKALLARTSLYSKKYDEALIPTQQIINSGLYRLSADANNLNNSEIFWGFDKRNNTEFNNFFNKGSYVPAIRYTESFLISAEALLNSGNTAGAINYLNMLNARRGNPMISSITTNYLLQQWKTELDKEGDMFATLKRFDAALSVVQNNPSKLLLPIPQQISNNNGNLIQNPGY